MIEIRNASAHVVSQLDTEERIAEFLSDALLQGGSAKLVEALKDVAWARVISHLAIKLGVPRQEIAQMMSGTAPLSMDVLGPLLSEFRVKLAVTPLALRADLPPETPATGYVKRF